MSGRPPRYIGVDFDGTLATWPPAPGNHNIAYCGQPIPAMVERIRGWLAQGIVVKIVTARMAVPPHVQVQQRDLIHAWLAEQGLPPLEVTNAKTFGMIELWDDRAVQVEINTGRRIGNHEGPR